MGVVFLPGVNGHHQSLTVDLADGDPAFFAFAAVFIKQANGQWIRKYLAGFDKAYTVFVQIAGGFFVIPLKM